MRGNLVDLNAILHPSTVYNHPRDVLTDTALTRAEKKAILASWASDAAAVSSAPALRASPVGGAIGSIDEVLEALATLDHDGPRHPPGGAKIRLKPTERVDAAA
jgi:hypothetical protein